jgi:pyruvate kinase
MALREHRIRIVCTLGPAADDADVLPPMVSEGMNVARINMSHGQREEHVQRIARLRRWPGMRGIRSPF